METKILIELSPDQLDQMIRKAVREESNLTQLPPNTKQNIPRREAMKRLGVRSATTVIAYEKKGFLHPKKIGKRIFYSEDEIENALKEFQRV